MDKLPYKLLRTYVPSVQRAYRVGRDLTAFTYECGLKPLPNPHLIRQNTGAAWYNAALHAEARLTAVPHSEGTGWHQDGDMSPGCNMNHALVVWADRDPTQLSYNGKVYQLIPNEVVIFRNLICLHRRPPLTKGFRMSFRQRVEVPEWFGLP